MSDDKSLSRAEARYERLVAGLPAYARRWLTEGHGDPVEPDAGRFNRILAGLPTTVRERLQAEPEEPKSEAQEAVEELEHGPQWCLCEVHEGQYPKVRKFRELEVLVRYLARLEGQEVAVWPFLGEGMYISIPDEITGRRTLVLPGGEQAVLITQDGQLQFVDPPDPDVVEFQIDGWLGPACLSQVRGEFYRGNETIRKDEEQRIEEEQQKSKDKKKRKGQDDDDDQEQHAPHE